MKSLKSYKSIVLLGLLPVLVSVAQAENGQFPPANAVDTRPFPQQAPRQPIMRTMPVAPIQRRTQAPSVRMPVAPYAQRPVYSQPYSRTAPRNSQFNRRAMPNSRMLNNRVPRYPVNARQLPYSRSMPNRSTNSNTRNNNFPFSGGNMMPFGNTGSNSFNPFSNGNMPFSNGSNGMMPTNPMNNMFGSNNNSKMPFFPSNNNENRKKAWGTERNIWPDFYTDFTDDAWDTVMSGPRDLGKMPGGWRFPYISMPDPVTVSDAITNQFPPIAEEAGNLADFSDWGVFE